MLNIQNSEHPITNIEHPISNSGRDPAYFTFSPYLSAPNQADEDVKHIAIFASGTGSNARKIIEYFADHEEISVALVVSNKATAPVLDMAREHGVSTLVINRTGFYDTDNILQELSSFAIDLDRAGRLSVVGAGLPD